MISYLLKMIACSAVFLVVYLLLLEREKMHRFNRWYLLGSIVLSFLIPFIRLQSAQEILPMFNDAYIVTWEPVNILATPSAPASSAILQTQETQTTSGFTIPLGILLYGLITLIMLARFTRNIHTLISAKWNRKIIREHGFNLIIVKGNISSYTFFNTIFISEADYPANGSNSPILTHELAHVRQKHSWDVLFIELVKVFFWFNPVFLFFKKAIQLNHEFLADAAVLGEQTDVSAYQYLLLDMISRGTPLSLGSSFNYAVTKKRLIMMIKKQNTARSVAKQATGILAVFICLLCFSTKPVLSRNLRDNLPVPIITQTDTTPNPLDSSYVIRRVPMGFLKDVPYTQQGLSEEELQEYRALEKKYGLRKTNKTPPYIDQPDVDTTAQYRMEILFKKMNREQQQSSSIIFWPPLKPYKKLVPTEEQMKRWATNKDYGIWIGDKRIKNEDLLKYKPSDFSYYDASNLTKNAVNYWNHKVQLNLWTNKDFEASNKRLAAEKHFSMMRLSNRKQKPS